MHNKLHLLCYFFVILLNVSFAQADAIVEDDFETSSMTKMWGSLADASIVKLPGATGRNGYGMRFFYPGVASDKDGWAEARFDLGGEYQALTIEFDLYIPSNYVHRRPSDNTDNNKFFRLWRTTYDDIEKIGASTLGQGTTGISMIGTDYRQFADWGQSTAVKSANGFIAADDRGKWMAVRIDVKSATDSSLGSIKIFKNGKLYLDDSSIKNHVPGTQGYRYGYLLGWANSGFSEDTVFYIDNVKFLNKIEARPLPPTPR